MGLHKPIKIYAPICFPIPNHLSRAYSSGSLKSSNLFALPGCKSEYNAVSMAGFGSTTKIPMPVVWFTTPVTSFFMKEHAQMLRHHHFSQQVLLAERVASSWFATSAGVFAPARLRRHMLEVQTEITSMRHLFGFHAANRQRREYSVKRS